MTEDDLENKPGEETPATDSESHSGTDHVLDEVEATLDAVDAKLAELNTDD